MRRRLLPALPALAHWFGIMPWHVDGRDCLTRDELDAFLDALPRQQPTAARPAGGRRYGPGR